MTGPRTVAWFDAAAPDLATAAVRPICASRRWTDALLAGRPFASLAALEAGSEAALDSLDWPELEQALAAHPRIGERAPGNSTEARWSREEQASASAGGGTGGSDGSGDSDENGAGIGPDERGDADDGADLARQLHAGNLEYEQHFGFVFLICATGKSARDILSQLRARLANPVAAEREVVRAELKDIVALRLSRSFR